MPKRDDSVKTQLYEACQQNRVAAQLLDYFMNVHAMKLRKYPDADPESPELWMDFAREDLAAKFLVSDKTIRRAILCLVDRRFVTIHKVKGLDRTNRYQLHRSLVDTLFQELPLFETLGTEVVHLDKMTDCIRSKCPDASGQNVRMHSVKMTGCIYPLPSPSYSLPSPSRDSADADKEKQILGRELEAEAEVLTDAEPGQVDQETADTEREGILQRLREIGIAKEHAEAHLTRHSRQKLQAALACLASDRRTRLIKSEAGYVLGFLQDPAKYGYELDSSGCWRSSKAIAQEIEQQRAAARSRDRPELSDRQSTRRAAAIAWDQLTPDQQQAIRQAVRQQYPDKPAMRQAELCCEMALTLYSQQQEAAPCPK